MEQTCSCWFLCKHFPPPFRFHSRVQCQSRRRDLQVSGQGLLHVQPGHVGQSALPLPRERWRLQLQRRHHEWRSLVQRTWRWKQPNGHLVGVNGTLACTLMAFDASSHQKENLWPLTFPPFPPLLPQGCKISTTSAATALRSLWSSAATSSPTRTRSRPTGTRTATHWSATSSRYRVRPKLGSHFLFVPEKNRHTFHYLRIWLQLTSTSHIVQHLGTFPPRHPAVKAWMIKVEIWIKVRFLSLFFVLVFTGSPWRQGLCAWPAGEPHLQRHHLCGGH